MRIEIQLFAVARQRIGRSTIEVEIDEGATVADLRAAIGVGYPVLATILASSRIAVDSEYAPDDRLVQLGAEIALIPPVSGGQGSPKASMTHSPPCAGLPISC